MKEINGGKLVLCDLCNRDGDALMEDGLPLLMGGAIIGSNAVCEICLRKFDKRDIDLQFDKRKTFGDNVRAYRTVMYGTDDCIIKIYGLTNGSRNDRVRDSV